MRFQVDIATNGAAFEGPGEPGGEVARILRDLADRVEDGGNSFPLRDVNGNRVGSADYVTWDESDAYSSVTP